MVSERVQVLMCKSCCEFYGCLGLRPDETRLVSSSDSASYTVPFLKWTEP